MNFLIFLGFYHSDSALLPLTNARLFKGNRFVQFYILGITSPPIALSCRICCTMLFRSSSSCPTSLQHSYSFAVVHTLNMSLFTNSNESSAFRAFIGSRTKVPFKRMSLLTHSRPSSSLYSDLTCLLVPCYTALVASSNSSLAHNFWTAYRSHILIPKPFALKAPDIFLERPLSDHSIPNCSGHFCNFFLPANYHSNFYRGWLAVVFHQNGLNITLFDAQKLDTLRSPRHSAESLTALGTKPNSPKLLFSSTYHSADKTRNHPSPHSQALQKPNQPRLLSTSYNSWYSISNAIWQLPLPPPNLAGSERFCHQIHAIQ